MAFEPSRLRDLTERFASLQAAHRALARSVHPAQLEPVRRQSRALLIQLQALSAQSRGEASADSVPASPESVERELDDQAARTRAILAGIDIAQLRATIPNLAVQYPEEVRGLVDVLVSGQLDSDKSLRILEYLITVLSADERGGRRVLIQEPSRATARLHLLASRQLAELERADAAVRELEDATTQVLREDEIGDIRDKVRRYKEALGVGLLHPRVLAAAVGYNVAMWNRVAAEIDSSRSIEQLAEGLFVPATEGVAAGLGKGAGQDVLGSPTWSRVVAAFRQRVLGQAVDAADLRPLVEPLALASLRADDVEVFTEEQADESHWLMRSAVVLGQLLRDRAQADPALVEIGIDPEQLAGEAFEELGARMTALARKLMADSRYADAFKISDVKTHALAAHAAARSVRRRGVDERSPRRTDGRAVEAPAGAAALLAQLLRGLPLGRMLLIGVLLAGFLALVVGSPGRRESDAGSVEDSLASISPFLEWGRHSEGETPGRFVGRVGRTWDWLGTPERRLVAARIGAHFAELGTPRVVLMDVAGEVVARYADGHLLVLEPRIPAAGE